MALYKEWENLIEQERKMNEVDKFWKTYFEAEMENYKKILDSGKTALSGKLIEMAESYSMDAVTFTGFLDGINTSLENPIDMDSLNEDSSIDVQVNFEKLYYNMLGANADWLYNLKEWDKILTQDKRKEILIKFHDDTRAVSDKIGRNEPCICGSNKKYKKCCGA